MRDIERERAEVERQLQDSLHRGDQLQAAITTAVTSWCSENWLTDARSIVVEQSGQGANVDDVRVARDAIGELVRNVTSEVEAGLADAWLHRADHSLLVRALPPAGRAAAPAPVASVVLKTMRRPRDVLAEHDFTSPASGPRLPGNINKLLIAYGQLLASISELRDRASLLVEAEAKARAADAWDQP